MGVVFLKYQNNIDSAHWSISTFVWQLGLYNPSSACTKELNEAGFKWFAMIDFKLLTRAVLFRKCLKLMLSFSVSFGCWVTVFHNFHQSIGVEHLLFLRNFQSLEFSKYMKNETLNLMARNDSYTRFSSEECIQKDIYVYSREREREREREGENTSERIHLYKHLSPYLEE